MIEMAKEKNSIKKQVRKIRIKVTLALIIFTVILILSTLHLIDLSDILPLFYFVGIIFGFIGLIARSISMWDYVDKEGYINKKGDIKYRWYEVSEQCKIIKRAYFFKYPIFIIFTIPAFISWAMLTLNNFVNQPLISLILVSGLSLVVGFILEWPKGIS